MKCLQRMTERAGRRSLLILSLSLCTVHYGSYSQVPSEDETQTLLKAIAQNTGQELPLSVSRTLLQVHYLNTVNRHARVFRQLSIENGVNGLDDVKAELKWPEFYYQVARANVEQTKFRHDIGRWVVKGLDLVPAEDPVTVLGIKAVSKISDPLMAGTEALANWAVDFGISKAFTVTDTEAKIRDFTKISFIDSNGNVDSEKLKTATDFFQADFVNNPAFRDLPPDKQAELAHAMQARLENVVDRQGLKIDQIFEQMKEVDGNAATAVDLIRKTKSAVEFCASKQQEFAEQVQVDQKEINTALANLSGEIANNNGLANLNNHLAADNGLKLGVIMDAMYDELPTTKKLEWLKGEYFTLPPGIDKAKEISHQEHIKIVEHQLAISEKLQGYLETGAKLLQFAQDLGLPSKAVEAASKAIRVAEGANGTVQKLISGNYLGAVASVGKLLFGGGPDIGEIRQQQIMKQFGVVNEKLDALIKGEQFIFDAVEGIDQKVTELAHIVVSQNEDISRQLLVIEDQVAFNTELLDQVLRRDLDGCKYFLEIRKKSNYDDMWNFFVQRTDAFEAGERMVSTWMSDVDPASSDNWGSLNRWFLMRTHLREHVNDKLIYALETELTADRATISSSYTNVEDQKRLWSSLTIPATTVEAVEAKIGLIEFNSSPVIPMPYQVIDRLFSPEAVVEFSEAASAFTDFFFLVDRSANPPRLFTSQQLDTGGCFTAADMKARREKADLTLKFCLGVINATIAQQSLLAGDAILPRLAETIDSETTQNLMKENKVLAKNVLMYSLLQRLHNEKNTVLAYDVALHSKDSFYLEQLTKMDGKTPWKFVNEPESVDDGATPHWFVTLSDAVKLELPPADEVRAGILEIMPGVLSVAQVREHIISKIAEIKMAETLPADHALRLGLINLSTPK